MQQTLLSLLALMVVMFLSLSQRQTDVQNDRSMVRAELQQMALGVAKKSMEIVRARYDSEAVGLASGNDCEAFGGSTLCDDVEDFHEMVPATVPFTLPDGKIDFQVEIEVQYVDKDLQPTGGVQTSRKEVIISVQDDPSDGDPRLYEPIKFSEVLSGD